MVRWFLCLVLLLPQLLAEEKKVRLATCEWPPYVSKSLKGDGLTACIVRAALETEGYEVQIDFMPWARVMKAVEKQDYDGGFPAYFSEERTKTYNYSNDFLLTPLYLCKLKKSDIEYKGLESLKDYRIGIVNGYINSPEFDAADYLNKKPANDDQLNLMKLLGNRVDIAVIDMYTALHLTQTTVSKAKGQLDFMAPPLHEKNVHLLTSNMLKNSKEILSDFNKGLIKIKENGQYNKILKDFGFLLDG